MAHPATGRRQPQVRPARADGRELDVFDFQLTDEEMGRIAALDTGASLFFDHRDPEMVSQIGNVRRS